MISSKYLFSIVAGLTAGANGVAFGIKHNDPAGGGNQLSWSLNNINNYYSENSKLADLEGLRLERERATSLKNSKDLESKNEDVNSKGKERSKRGAEIEGEKESLDSATKGQKEKLASTKTEAEGAVSSASKSLNQQFKSFVEKYRGDLKGKVDGEVKKIEEALKNIQQSNQELIEKVKKDILELPERIFKEEGQKN